MNNKDFLYLDIPGANVKAIINFFEKLDISINPLTDNKSKNNIIIIPGVGNCKHHIEYINSLGLGKSFIQNNNIISICAGFQIMCKHIEEGPCIGLGLLDFDIKKITSSKQELNINTGFKECSDGKKYFFNHSYAAKYDDECSSDGIYFSFSGKKKIVSHIISEKDLHCQFHPELSGKYGIQLIYDFLKNIS